jgi:hypothetical protein
LESFAGDRVTEQVERLAHHALRGEVWDKALGYCRQAGDKALAQSARREVVAYFESALSVLPYLPKTRATQEQAIDLRLALRTALHLSGDLGHLLALLREAEALAVALDDTRRLGQISVSLTVYFRHMGEYDQALTLAEGFGMRPLMAHCHLGLGTLYGPIGQSEQARTALSTALTLLRSMGMTFWLPQAEAVLATVYERSGPLPPWWR